jgi:hypothetical protein
MRQISIAVSCLVVLGGCGGSDGPTTATTPTPTAAPTATPTATPNPFAAACGSPLPNIADMYGFGIKVQLEPGVRKKILNANPFVRNDEYCAAVRLGGRFCETRLETDPGRVACDHYITGISDEGGPGPIWYQVVNGRNLRCGGLKLPGDAPGCSLKPENQYLLDVHLPGKYIACGGAGSNGSCGVCILEEENFDTPPEFLGSRRPGLCLND